MTPAEPRSEPGRVPLAMGLIAALMVAKLLFHLAALTQYGWFRDELYYAASTEHLAWGYVEHPPLSIALLALVRTVFGDSLAAIRLVPALAGAATVLVTALITRRLGGGRFAQGLAALTAVLAPVFLGTGRTYSMNALDLLLWALAALTLLRALDQGRVRDWTALGIVLGLGLLNKISILWFGAGLLAAFLVTPYRRLLLRPGPWIAGGAAFAMFVPHLAWQVRNGWPTLEFMRNATQLKMAEAPPGEFLARQILEMNPGAAPVWIAGLLFGLFARDRRLSVLAWIYLATLAILLTEGHGRASYLSVAYPMLLALGGVAFERFTLPAALRWIRPAIGLLVIVTGLIAVPMALPVLPVETFVRYQAALGFEPRTEERLEVGPLPQHYADMFGWDSMVGLVAEAWRRLPPEERARCRVYGQNYGEAGAVDVLGRRLGLPPAISGHNTYWLWGPGPADPDVLIIIGGAREDNAEFYEEIEIVGQTRSPWSMPYERGLDVSIARKPKVSLRGAWPRLRRTI